MSGHKSDALQQIQKLIVQNDIQKFEILTLFESEKSTSALMKVLQFFAGLLVVCGFVFFGVQIWDDLGATAQILMTFGLSVMSFVVGLLIYKKDIAFATALLLIPIALEPLGAGVVSYHVFGEAFIEENMRWISLIILSLMSCQYYVASLFHQKLKLLVPFSMLFAIAALFVLTSSAAHTSGVNELDAFAILTALLGVSFIYEKKSGYNPWMGLPYVIGTVGFIFAGAELLIFNDSMEIFKEGIICFLALITLFAGYKVDRRFVIWPSIAIAVWSFAFGVLKAFDFSSSAFMFLALFGVGLFIVLNKLSKNLKMLNQT
jgi:hypothetical protein